MNNTPKENRKPTPMTTLQKHNVPCTRMDDIKKEIEKSQQERFSKQKERTGTNATGTNATAKTAPVAST